MLNALSPDALLALSLATLPALPSPTLAVPEGNQLAFHADATGVQIYACAANAAGVAWAFQGPEASLRDQHGHVVFKHYAGPTWQSVSDNSKVVASKVSDFSANPKAIPELLLRASSHEGAGVLADVTYIQRLKTSGGLAPSAGCDAAHVGATVRIAYSASYFFYRAKLEPK
ncbi:MAG TPA: DUF3455 domain-containing protein [Polyangiaceae bacterium]|jgi:hypothetical protein|nr:DUF3455 domain-containing protein [Polyangiaceae bacterium]